MRPAKVLPRGPFKTVPMCTVCQRNPERCNSDVAECSHIDCPHRGKAWAQRYIPTPTPSTITED